MPDGPTIILTLKILVSTVTVLYAAAVIAIIAGRKKLHGRLNTAFFILTMTTVVGFEVLLRLGIDATANFSDAAREALRIHLYFAIPSALLLPLMMLTGVRKWKALHITTGVLFTLLWLGTFVSGVFFLPHDG